VMVYRSDMYVAYDVAQLAERLRPASCGEDGQRAIFDGEFHHV